MMNKLSKNFVHLIDRLYWLDKKFFSEDELEKLRLKCTVEGPPEFGSRNPIGPDIPIFEETKELLGIPRALGIREFGFWPERSRLVDARIENYKFTGILRDKQKLAYDVAVKKLQEPPFSGIIALPPGAGKTVLGLAIVEHFQTKTIVVVHKEFLMDQWIDRILQFTNVKRNEIGKVQADSADVSGKKIVLGMMQSLYQKEYSNVFDKFGMVIYDEAHRSAAEEWGAIGKRFSAKYKFGVSATVSRGDDTDRILNYHLGEIIYEDLKYEVVPKVFQTGFILDFSQEDVSNRRGEVNYSRMITKISECGRRNDWIIKEVIKAHSKDRKILVLSHRLNQLREINHGLTLAGISHFDTGFYIGGLDLLDRKRSEGCRIILATVQLAMEGLDIPDLDCLIFATPLNKIEQPIGRTLRKIHGKRQPVIVDIVDNLRITQNLAAKRREKYEELGFDTGGKKKSLVG